MGFPLISSKPERWWKGTIFQVASKREVQSEITAPLVYHDRTVGVMQVLSYKTNAYDSHDLDLIMLIARQAAVAIENARLFDAQRSEQKPDRSGRGDRATGLAQSHRRRSESQHSRHPR